MNNPQIFHFFLGGHDAEMMGIKNILSSHDDPFEDADLQWGNAKVSVYTDKLAALPVDSIPVFIELGMDAAVPDRSCIIDHHGEHAGMKQSCFFIFNCESNIKRRELQCFFYP